MQRPFPACGITSRLEKLELQNPRKEITGIGRVAGNMIFGSRIKAVCGALDRRHDSLILSAQIGPALVVIGGRDRPVKHPPTPFIDEQAKGQKRHLVHRLTQQQPGILFRPRHFCLIEQSDLHQIFGRDRQRDGIANRFVETVIRAIQMQIALACYRRADNNYGPVRGGS